MILILAIGFIGVAGIFWTLLQLEGEQSIADGDFDA